MSKCEDCPSFQGRGYNNFCKMGLYIREGDMRTCEDFGKSNQKALLIDRNIWEKIKKYWI